jgi:hypothetical protein
VRGGTAAPAAPTVPAAPARVASGARGGITRAEGRWLAVIGAALTGLLAVPSLVWLLAGPRDLVHVGSFWYPGDFPVYLAAMDQGARAPGWLIYDRFTPEPHGPAFMFPLYVGIGKLAALVGLPPLTLYYLGEVVGRVILLVALYVFAAAFLPTVGQRRLALALMLMGTNLTLWAALLLEPVLSRAGTSEALPLGAQLEVTTLGVFLAPLHLMVGLACTVLAIAAFAAASEPGAGWRARAGLAASVLGLALVHPFNLPVVLVLFGLYSAVALVQTRRWPWPALVATVLAGVVAAPWLLYNYYTFRVEPFWSVVYGQQNTVPSPSPLRLVLDYGPVLLLAPLAWWAWPPPRAGRPTLALLAGAVLLLALYAPVPFQRRLAFGVQPVLAVLAAAALAAWAVRLGARGRRRLGLTLAALGLPTAIFLYGGVVASALANTPLTVYVASRAEWAAGEWLAARMMPDEVVLATEKSGFWLAALVPGRVWLGHEGITYDVPTKRAVVAEVLAAPPAEAARRLAAHGVTYLYYGPRERALGALTPAPGLEPVYESPEVVIYRVTAGP